MTAEQQRLVTENRALAHKVAYNMAGHDPDAHAVALEGLCTAAIKYDPHRRRSSWKYIAIRSIKSALHTKYWPHQYPVYVPTNVLEDKQYAHQMADGDDARAIHYYQSPEKGFAVYRAKRMTSMDKEIDEDGNTIHDTVGADGVESAVIRRGVQDVVLQRVQELPPRHRYVIQRLYGIGMEQRRNSEIAEEMGVSRQRVQQIKVQVETWLQRDRELQDLA